MASSIFMKTSISKSLDYLSKDIEGNLPKIMNLADKIDVYDDYKAQRDAVWSAIENPSDPYYYFIRRIIRDVDLDVLKTIIGNFFVNANLSSISLRDELREKYNCNIPWAILLDPTTNCNLHCTGCWASEYGDKLNLSYEDMDSIVYQGKELGVYFYLFSGGEPLMRKTDILRLCKEHDDCMFLAFTNGTLIDKSFAQDMLRVKNFIPAISIEGSENVTDYRRGIGAYNDALDAMRLLRDCRLPFGVSCCYTSMNFDDVVSEDYWNLLIRSGAFFAWYFHYMPVGVDAVPDLLPSPKQREFVYHRIREFRKRKPLFAIDFQNDGEYVGGCVAGGRRYLHINSNGDAEPCAFIHYSDSNIHDKSLLEILQSPLFTAYHNRQPFNSNMLMPCPMLENPEELMRMVLSSKARSTDMKAPESVENLISKCVPYSTQWEMTAHKLWNKKRP